MTLLPRHALILAVCLGSMLVAPNQAFAEEGEHALSAGASLMVLTHPSDAGGMLRFAPGAGIGYRYAIDDFWELGASLTLGGSLGADKPEAFIGHALFESRYVIDALTWVPYLCFGLGALVRGGGPRLWESGMSPSVDLTGHAGLGVEWRPARSWSIGLEAKYVVVLSDISQTTGPVQVRASASWYFD